jgi:hypothetical protein
MIDFRRRLAYLPALLLALTGSWAGATSLPPGSAEPADADWKESPVTLPTGLSTQGLLPLEMPRYVSLSVGIDPQSLQITPEGLVRYVAVAVNASGSATGMYEGLRCATGEVRTYARTNSAGTWVEVKDSPWRDLTSNGLPSKHALAFARQGACDGRSSAANTVTDIVRALKK